MFHPCSLVWPLEMGIWSLNPPSIVLLHELAKWTLNTRSIVWPLETGIALNSHFLGAWCLCFLLLSMVFHACARVLAAVQSLFLRCKGICRGISAS